MKHARTDCCLPANGLPEPAAAVVAGALLTGVDTLTVLTGVVTLVEDTAVVALVEPTGAVVAVVAFVELAGAAAVVEALPGTHWA